MSATKITEKLTPEQEALILFYREKWRVKPTAGFANALSTEPIDYQKASATVKAAYRAFGFKEPEIFFCSNPY